MLVYCGDDIPSDNLDWKDVHQDAVNTVLDCGNPGFACVSDVSCRPGEALAAH